MTCDIFIRTYVKDYEWLTFALKSIHKHVTGFRNIIVVSPDITDLSHLKKEQVYECVDLPEGYVGQQYTKLEAWRYTDADFIVYWDSDVVATEPMDLRKELFRDGLPIMWMTPYAKLLVEGAAWKHVVQKWLGFEMNYEYMRRQPLVYHRETVYDCFVHLTLRNEGNLFRAMKTKVPNREFTEFNILGSFAYLAQKATGEEMYLFLDTEVEAPPPNKAHQAYSWGGMTPEVMEIFRKAGLV